MPIHRELRPPSRVIHTVLTGRVTDEELLDYYQRLIPSAEPGVWREVVDSTAVTDMAISVDGQTRLAAFVGVYAARLQDGKVAMVASSDVVYGMFRMWEIQREELGYTVKVFRRLDEALAWIGQDTGGERA